MAGLSDPYAILRVGPQTFTSQHIDNTDSPKWGEMYEVRTNRDFWIIWDLCHPSIPCMYKFWTFICVYNIFSLLRDFILWCWQFIFYLRYMRRASTEIPLCHSSRPYVCPVHQVIVHEVPGQELEVEVYDKDPDQDDFLGRYICIIHVVFVCCCGVSHAHLSPFICYLPWTVGKNPQHLMMHVFYYNCNIWGFYYCY